MFVLSNTGDLPLPTREELLVVEHLLYRCVHPQTARSQDRDGFLYTTCERCGDYRVRGHLRDGKEFTDQEVADGWLRTLPRPATHHVVANQVLAAAEQNGWSVMIGEGASTVVCTLRKGERVARSAAHPTRAAAIVDAASQIAAIFRR